ncbi:MAG: cysteinyl-tRNA synthetase [Myxococcota bacterium]|jgi:cysteinyl-tRNA synthetase
MPARFRIYNTLTRSVEDFEPLKPGHVGLYVCGMTVYDDCHVGHSRAMVVFDTFVRYLRHRGWQVTFVRNFTDVDDKIITRAAASGEAPLALAERYIRRFHEDVGALGLALPDHEPRVSTSMGAILKLIGNLVRDGHAYEANGNVWFDVGSFPEYGRLSGRDEEGLANPDAFGDKRSPRDFALWKSVKPGEPSWESPWGPGRPGWHIECSAMAEETLGATFDIHGGGLDLVFPHHENEIAQSQCGNHAPFANVWMHNGLLVLPHGGKMGKSDAKSMFPIREAIERFPAEAVRLYLLQNHYRSPIVWTGADSLADALGQLARLYDARELAEGLGGSQDADEVADSMGADARTVLDLGRSLEARLHAALDDDFNTSLALGHAFELARAINRFAAHKKARKRGGPVVAPALAGFAVLADAVGLLSDSAAAFQEQVKAKRLGALGLDSEAVEASLVERTAARQAKDWATSDRIRDELAASGVVVRDTATGTEWRLKLHDGDA